MTSGDSYFISQIYEDLIWREQELAILKKQVFQARAGTIQQQVFLRSAVAMTYAHYEGFCKFALTVYIDALSKFNLKRKDLKWQIASFSLEGFLVELKSQKSSADFFTKFLDDFDSFLEQPPVLSKPESIANLWPDLLAEWMKNLALPAVNINSKKTQLDSLVTSRNQIAHGKKLTIDTEAALDVLFNAATLAMHEVAVGIDDALKKKSYRRHCEVRTILGHATS